MCQKECQKEFYVRRIGSKQNRSRIEVTTQRLGFQEKRQHNDLFPRVVHPTFKVLYQSSWNHKHTLHLVDWYRGIYYLAQGLE